MKQGFGIATALFGSKSVMPCATIVRPYFLKIERKLVMIGLKLQIMTLSHHFAESSSVANPSSLDKLFAPTLSRMSRQSCSKIVRAAGGETLAHFRIPAPIALSVSILCVGRRWSPERADRTWQHARWKVPGHQGGLGIFAQALSDTESASQK